MTFFEWLNSQKDREDAPGKFWGWASRDERFETLGDDKLSWAMTLCVRQVSDNVWTWFYAAWSEWEELR